MAVDQSDASVIVAALSPERIAPYLRATGGGDLDAVRLYEWNLAISGALSRTCSRRNVPSPTGHWTSYTLSGTESPTMSRSTVGTWPPTR